jgi:L-ascorbate metabolism protein UlaG (beta-lactamase superfamily)
MQRRQLFQFFQNGLLFTASLSLAPLVETLSHADAQVKATPKPQAKPQIQPTIASPNLTLQWLGHMSFLSSGNGVKILTHPFRPGGCTAGLTIPQLSPDLALVSSRLLDEGYLTDLPSNVKVLQEPGAYNLSGINFQGIRMFHDRLEGRRFGTNIAWLWNQGNFRILHLGGAAAPLTSEQRILIGRPNILILPVGGGLKGYNAQEAKQVMDSLNPQIAIPCYYRSDRAASSCDLEPLEQFLNLVPDRPINRLAGNTFSLASLPQEPTVFVFKL